MIPQIISIEGVDGAGKTSLARELKKALNYEVLDLNTQMVAPSSGSALVDWLEEGQRIRSCPDFDRDSWRVAAVALETLHFAGAKAILDRTTLSCWAYQQRNDPDLRYLEQVICHVKPTIILLDTEVDECMKRDKQAAQRWGWEGLNWQRHRMLASAECFAKRGVPVITVHRSKAPASSICRSVLKEMGAPRDFFEA